MRQVFYKSAQIFVGDLNGMCPLLKGLEQLTGFADYRILQGLLSLDVLDITPELRARIMAREELCPGSEDEVEIRATALVTIRAIQQLFLRSTGGALMRTGSTGSHRAMARRVSWRFSAHHTWRIIY